MIVFSLKFQFFFYWSPEAEIAEVEVGESHGETVAAGEIAAVVKQECSSQIDSKKLKISNGEVNLAPMNEVKERLKLLPQDEFSTLCSLTRKVMNSLEKSFISFPLSLSLSLPLNLHTTLLPHQACAHLRPTDMIDGVLERNST